MTATKTTSLAVHDRATSRAARARETAALCAELAGVGPDEAAPLRERLILVNCVVAEAVAARYDQRGVPIEDLRQVACEGLVKAARRFDASRRNDFLTYAVPTIQGEIRRHFRDRGWVIRPPRAIQEIQSRLPRVIDELQQVLGRGPSPSEVAEAVGVSDADYDRAMGAYGCFQPTSLDTPTRTEGDSAMTLGDLIAGPDGSAGFGEAEARAMLAPVMGCLSARDRRILYLRFFDDLTQREIGEDLGISQMQVSRVLQRILGRLRQAIEASTNPEVAVGVAS